MDDDNVIYFPRLLPNPTVRSPIGQILRPLLLDARHPSLQSGHAHGAWHLPNRHIGFGYAASGWIPYH